MIRDTGLLSSTGWDVGHVCILARLRESDCFPGESEQNDADECFYDSLQVEIPSCDQRLLTWPMTLWSKDLI